MPSTIALAARAGARKPDVRGADAVTVALTKGGSSVIRPARAGRIFWTLRGRPGALRWIKPARAPKRRTGANRFKRGR